MDNRDIIDLLHTAVASDLLARVQSGQATSQELSVAVKFLKDNGANLDVITAENPMADLLHALPFDMAERLQ
jgi:hypothetical protein